jgi:hypothetical protein
VKRTGPGRGALGFYAVLLTAAFLLLVHRLYSAHLLTSSDVVAYEGQLDGLRRRTRVVHLGDEDRVHLAWTLANRCGAYRGLALLTQWRRGLTDGEPETHLAFRLEVEPAGLPRNPRRGRLPVARLVRDDPASDLVPRGHPRRLEVQVERGDGGERPPLAIDNLAPPRGAALASAAARRLGFAVARHCKPDALDVAVLTLLARTLRARLCADLDAAEPQCLDTAVALYPDVHRGTYRVDLAALAAQGRPEPDVGRLRLRLRLSVTLEDRPRRGSLALLSETDLRLPAQVFVTAPKGAGADLSPDDPGLVVLRWDPASRALHGNREIDFAALLSETNWW